jgi:hypothetical protein
MAYKMSFVQKKYGQMESPKFKIEMGKTLKSKYDEKDKSRMAIEKERLLKDKDAVEAYEVDGKVIQIFTDEDPENPREWDNLGTMACSHRRYSLGDDEAKINIDNYGSWEEVKKHLIKDEKAVVIMPLYLYDHSGITMSTKPFGDRWDSGQVGYIYATQERLDKEYEGYSQKKKLELAKKVLEGEVKTYDQFITGDIYTFAVTDLKSGEDSRVSGFYGIKHAKEEAEDEAKSMGKK